MLKRILASLVFIAPLSFLSSEEIDLSSYEYAFYSRSGEDGVIAKIFKAAELSSSFCVELGSGDGEEPSNTLLLRLQGWKALLLDRMYENPGRRLFKEFVTAENVNDLLAKYNVPNDLDLLCIDTGYNDYYLWRAIDPNYQPSVVMIRYNPLHLPSVDKVVKYHPYFGGDHTNYYGASMLAMNKLGQSKDYTLIYAEESGSYLFFIRNQILKEKELLFKNSGDVEKIYASLKEIPSFPQDSKLREYLSSDTLEDKKP